MQIYLYIKTHNITGLKYFGKTTHKDPFKYKGSGKYWKKHIRKHGYDVTTEILGCYSNEHECSIAALKFSQENDITNSNLWANLQNENGYDGAPIGHKGHQFTFKERHKMSQSARERWQNEDYRNKVISTHKQRHIDSPNLASTSAQKAIENQKSNGTYETVQQKRAQCLRNFLAQLDDEGCKMHYAFARSKKSKEHKQRISKAHKDVPKSDQHKRSLAISKQYNHGILIDHNGDRYEVYKDFLDKYNLDRKFLINLDQIITRPSLSKLGLDYKKYYGKTKRELGFTFLKEDIDFQ